MGSELWGAQPTSGGAQQPFGEERAFPRLLPLEAHRPALARLPRVPRAVGVRFSLNVEGPRWVFGIGGMAETRWAVTWFFVAKGEMVAPFFLKFLGNSGGYFSAWRTIGSEMGKP